MASITVDDRAFVAAYQQALQHIDDQAKSALRTFAENAKESARRHIHSVSGDLASRLTIEDHLNEPEPYIEIGVDETGDLDPHAFYHEFGTSKDSPHPYMRPGLEEAKAAFKVEP